MSRGALSLSRMKETWREKGTQTHRDIERKREREGGREREAERKGKRAKTQPGNGRDGQTDLARSTYAVAAHAQLSHR